MGLLKRMIKWNKQCLVCWEFFLGSGISAIVSCITTKMRIKQDESNLTKNIELDKAKMNRKEDLEKLNILLKPVLNIYSENKSYIEIGDLHDKKFHGKGLTYNNATRIIKLFDDNLQYIDLELLEIYSELKSQHDYDVKINANYEYGRISNNIFDEEKILYNAVKNRALTIENKYS